MDIRAFIHRPDQLELRLIHVSLGKSAAGDPTVSPLDDASGSSAAARKNVFETFTGSETTSSPTPAASAGSSTADARLVPARATTSPASAFVDDPVLARGGGGVRWTMVNDFGKRPVLVGQWWSTNPGTMQRWVYSKGATSALEAAFTLAGDNGEYKHSETNTSSSTGSVGFPKVNGKAGKFFYSFFKYGRFKAEEYDYATGKWYYIGHWVRRTHWAKGQDDASGIKVPATKPKNCAPYLPGGDDTTEKSTAVTWTNGVNLSGTMKGILGSVSLSSRTGFSTTATNYVLFHKRGRLCGVFGDLHKPGALVARLPS
ncbi:hypothetical protein [Nocardioides sp. T2.26MG-1]|uniref:hypothetical protein n=1 Tax=Nocardioides sp. T2.26MG-1 TaxID=3041166 RepID=UPI00253FA597|nr:hypothetical protein [Nocardioides sp. T2.26MG-1]